MCARCLNLTEPSFAFILKCVSEQQRDLRDGTDAHNLCNVRSQTGSSELRVRKCHVLAYKFLRGIFTVVINGR